MQVSRIDDRALLASLSSRTCPACAGPKSRANTFCGSCYHRLPPGQKRALYARFGRGYAEAVADAMGRLARRDFHLPAERAGRSLSTQHLAISTAPGDDAGRTRAGAGERTAGPRSANSIFRPGAGDARRTHNPPRPVPGD